MTQEEKDILLKDLCARLPYRVFLNIGEYSDYILQGIVHSNTTKPLIVRCNDSDFECNIEIVKPHLRPMSSMTDEEKSKMLTIFERPCKNPKLEVDEYYGIRYTKYAEDHRIIDMYYDSEQQAEWLDWLNAHHFDFRGLISMGLALEAPEDMYNKKEY